jgi:TetR/AcrR family transcriptional regulator, ethionamide resistance regulator
MRTMDHGPRDAKDHRPRVAAERRTRMRARLLDSTLTLVAERGVAATSIDDIIAAAQVSRGTFYKYFDAPDTLLRELALELTNDILRAVHPLVLKYDDPAARIATGMRVVVRLANSRPAVGSFFLRLGWPDIDRRHVLFDFVQHDLAVGIRRGRFTAMPIVLALNIVAGTALGAIHAVLGKVSARDIAEQAAASALRALGIEAEQAARLVALPLPQLLPVDGSLVARAAKELTLSKSSGRTSTAKNVRARG